MKYTLMLGCTKGTAPRLEVRLGESEYGTPEPQLHLTFPRGATFREREAVSQYYAACINLRTPTRERWCVNISVMTLGPGGTVYLELEEGSDREAKAAMQLLKEVTS